jgi:hypothetical protein
LRSENEREKNERHLLVGVLPNLLGDNLLNPLIEKTIRLLTRPHSLLRVGRRLLKMLNCNLTRLASVPNLRSGESEGEVDEFESLSDEPVLVRDLLDAVFGDVGTAEDAEGGFHVQVAELHLVRLSLRVGVGDPLGEVAAVDRVLHLEVDPMNEGR